MHILEFEWIDENIDFTMVYIVLCVCFLLWLSLPFGVVKMFEFSNSAYFIERK